MTVYEALAATGRRVVSYAWQMSLSHHDGSNLPFFDGHSKWAKRSWLEANPQIFHPDSTRLP